MSRLSAAGDSVEAKTVIRFGCAAAVWLAIGWWELNRGSLLSIPLPRRSLPIPILYWGGWVGYAWLLGRYTGSSLRRALARTVWVALGAQGLLLLTNLDRTMWSRAVESLEHGYRLYYVAFLCLVVAGLGVMGGRRRLRQHVQGLHAHLPFYSAALWLGLHLALTRHWWVLLAAALGLLSSRVWRRWPQLGAGWKRISGWLAGPRGTAAVLWALSWLVRWVYALRLMSATGADFVIAGDDSNTNDAFAWMYAQDPRTLLTIDPKIMYPPGYWIFLGWLYRWFGHRFGPVTFIQTCASAIVPVCVYWLTRRLIPTRTGEWAAKIAGLLTALNTGLIHCSVVLDQEAVYLPLLFMGLCALLQAVDRVAASSSKWLVVAGLLMGLANVMRPITVFVPVVVFLWLWGLRRRFWAACRETAWFTIPMVLVLVPLIIRNAVASGGNVIALTTEAAGQYRVSGNEPLLALGVDPFGDPIGTLRVVAGHPMAVAEAAWAVVPPRVVRFFFIPFFGTFDPVLIMNANALATPYALYLELYAYIAMALGAWWMVRYRTSRLGTILLLWITAYFSLTPVFWFVRNATYRVPLHPIFLIWLGAGIMSLWVWSRRKGLRRT